MNHKGIWITMAVVALFAGCKKEGNPAVADSVQPTGTVAFHFKNYVGDRPLDLQAAGYSYCNAHGDSFQVSAYKYYISNVRLLNKDGEAYAVPNSYYLIDQSRTTSCNRTLSDIPAGTYTTIKVLLGVDSTHNVSGAQDGDLDPLHGMFWTWSTGYIMAKVEGNFKKADGSGAGMSFHLGGFTGPYSVLREVSLTLPQALVVGDHTASAVSFKSDILKWFEHPNTINFQLLNQVGAVGTTAAQIADNYSRSLSVTSVEN